MIDGKRVLCVIPARGGSKRIPNKNQQKLFDDVSLMRQAGNVAVEAGVFDRIVVSTDITWRQEDYAPNVIRQQRPQHLSGDNVDLDEVIADTITSRQASTAFDYVVTLQPATPLRTAKLIVDMLHGVIASRSKGAITMARCVPWTWRAELGTGKNDWTPAPYPRSQDVKHYNLQEINTVQIAAVDVALSHKRWDLPLYVAELPMWACLDIDEPQDLEHARALFPVLYKEMEKIERFPFHVINNINPHRITGTGLSISGSWGACPFPIIKPNNEEQQS